MGPGDGQQAFGRAADGVVEGVGLDIVYHWPFEAQLQAGDIAGAERGLKCAGKRIEALAVEVGRGDQVKPAACRIIAAAGLVIPGNQNLP